MRVARAVVTACGLLAAGTPLFAQRVSFDRAGYRLSSIGERQLAVAHVLDQRGNPVSGVPITFRISDPSVATVSPRGEMVARRTGNTFVWAIAGKDSSSAIVLVEQLAAKFSFSPATLRIDALSTKVPLKIQASDAAGNPMPGGATRASLCRSLNDRVVTFSNAGDVTAVANGTTYIRCSDRGIADSLRVEVRQRPATVTISPIVRRAQKEVGDTFTVKAVGKDRNGKEIPDSRPTWASLDPTIVSVDPTSGKAQSRDAGLAKIVVQIGDIADTANISVTGTRAPTVASQQQAAPVKDSTPVAPEVTAAPKTALFKVTPMDVYPGEEKEILVAARDSNGAPMSLRGLRFEGIDTSIARIIPESLKVIGRKQGSVTIIARLQGFADTTSVNVNVRTTTVAFKEPVRHADSAAIDTRIRDSVSKVILTDSTAVARQLSRLALTVEGMALLVDHSTTSTVVESRTGHLIGGKGTLTMFRVIELTASVARGDLAPAPAGGSGTTTQSIEPLSIIQGDAGLVVYPASWLGVGGGIGRRTEQTPIGTQAWTIPRVSLINRFTFVGNIANTYTALSVLPGASLTPSVDAPTSVNVSGEAGLELNTSFFRLGVTYYVEQLKFNNSARVDEFSALRIRLGLSSARK